MTGKPRPIEQHIENGNPGKRPLPAQLPVEYARPECPEELSKEAKEIWSQICDRLEALRCLALSDFVAVELLAEAIASYREACRKVQATGMVILNEKKTGLTTSPFMRVRNQLWDQVLKGLSELGLTPVGRTKIARGAAPDDGDEVLKLLKVVS